MPLSHHFYLHAKLKHEHSKNIINKKKSISSVLKFNLYKHESTSLYNIFILFVSDDSTSNLRVRIINKDFHPSGKKDENKIIIKSTT